MRSRQCCQTRMRQCAAWTGTRGTTEVANALLVCLALLCLTSAASAQVLHVDASAAAGGDGANWSTAYSNLDEAIDAAAIDPLVTEIWVAGGIYKPGPAGARNSTFNLTDGVAIYGGFAGGETTLAARSIENHPTVLSGDLDSNDTYGSPDWDSAGWGGYEGNAYHVVSGNGVNSTAVLDGFEIIGGSSASGGIPVPFGNFGGGVFLQNSSPTIRNCLLRRNVASDASGAAIFSQNGSPTIESCTFEENRVFQGQGGGIYSGGTGNPVIRDSQFRANRSIGGSSAGGGAAIYLSPSSPGVIERCTFTENRAENFHIFGDPFGSFGGAIYNFADGTSILDCAFIGNRAHAGGGIYNWGDGVAITNCLFRDNFVKSYEIDVQSAAGGGGGGVAAQSLAIATTTITSCTFAKNAAGEGGGAMTYGEQAFVVRNCILFYNTATGEEVPVRQAQIKGDIDIAYCCIEELFQPQQVGDPPPNPAQFPGSTEALPAFADLGCGDLRLTPSSPCIDAGNNADVPTGITTDLVGSARFADDPNVPDTGAGTAPVVDLGAYEGSVIVPTAPQFRRGDANRNGAVNLSDVLTILNYLFSSGGAECLSALDTNDTGNLSISDAVHLLVYLFQGGTTLPAPSSSCGSDPTPDSLSCNSCLLCV